MGFIDHTQQTSHSWLNPRRPRRFRDGWPHAANAACASVFNPSSTCCPLEWPNAATPMLMGSTQASSGASGYKAVLMGVYSPDAACNPAVLVSFNPGNPRRFWVCRPHVAKTGPCGATAYQAYNPQENTHPGNNVRAGLLPFDGQKTTKMRAVKRTMSSMSSRYVCAARRFLNYSLCRENAAAEKSSDLRRYDLKNQGNETP